MPDLGRTRQDRSGNRGHPGVLALDRPLPPVARGDLLAVFTTGAYGMTMASNYNTRGRAAEVMVDGAQMYLIRQRENAEDLFALESIIK